MLRVARQKCGKFKIVKTKIVQYQNSNLIFYLSHFTRIAINEESFGSSQLANHSLSQEVKHDEKRNQISLFHHCIELLSTVRSALDFVTEEISGRQVSVSILGHDLITLGTLATTWSTKNPNDGQLGFSQGCFVNILPFQSLY